MEKSPVTSTGPSSIEKPDKNRLNPGCKVTSRTPPRTVVVAVSFVLMNSSTLATWNCSIKPLPIPLKLRPPTIPAPDTKLSVPEISSMLITSPLLSLLPKPSRLTPDRLRKTSPFAYAPIEISPEIVGTEVRPKAFGSSAPNVRVTPVPSRAT